MNILAWSALFPIVWRRGYGSSLRRPFIDAMVDVALIGIESITAHTPPRFQ